jgi:hypothetical protein
LETSYALLFNFIFFVFSVDESFVVIDYTLVDDLSTDQTITLFIISKKYDKAKSPDLILFDALPADTSSFHVPFLTVNLLF